MNEVGCLVQTFSGTTTSTQSEFLLIATGRPDLLALRVPAWSLQMHDEEMGVDESRGRLQMDVVLCGLKIHFLNRVI